jgi:hypothetical protein
MHTIPHKLLSALVFGAMATSALALTAEEHKAEKQRIEATYKDANKACGSMSGNAKDVCQKQAKGQEKISLAELKAKQDPTPSNQAAVGKARADADYDVAKEKCDDLKGNPKDVCVKDAKAAHVKGVEAAKVSEAKMEPGQNPQAHAANVAEARKDASKETREAQYKAAKERCDAMSGAAKDKCVADAQRMYGQ